MCPKVADPGVKDALVISAARLLAEEGPAALSTRRVAAAAGTSTMAVYTHFGGKEDLIRAIVWEGFERLATRLGAVRKTDDPVADLGQLALAYFAHARADPHLYAVMFGGSSLPEYAPTSADVDHGTSTFLTLVEGVQRCIDAGRFADRGGAFAMAAQLWASAHGVVSLEQHGFFTDEATERAAQLCVSLTIGFGDDPALAAASYRKARRRVTVPREAPATRHTRREDAAKRRTSPPSREVVQAGRHP